jgi:hypothetical protein
VLSLRRRCSSHGAGMSGVWSRPYFGLARRCRNIRCRDLPDEDFNYEEFVKQEFGSSRRPVIKTVWWITAILLVAAAGQLGTVSSSQRFKTEIRPMNKASEAVLALKPVTFHYKSDKTDSPEFGLIAEEVANVNPNLVVRDKNGEIYTVRYEAVNAMLLMSFSKSTAKWRDWR